MQIQATITVVLEANDCFEATRALEVLLEDSNWAQVIEVTTMVLEEEKVD